MGGHIGITYSGFSSRCILNYVVQVVDGMLQTILDCTKVCTLLIQRGDDSYIQKEVSQLITEIDRVANTTTFNEKMLLDGSFSKVSLQVGSESA